MNESTSKSPKPFQVAGIDLRCQVCEHDRFSERKGQLTTRVLTFFRLDFLNPAARCLICSNCGFVHWFMAAKTEG